MSWCILHDHFQSHYWECADTYMYLIPLMLEYMRVWCPSNGKLHSSLHTLICHRNQTWLIELCDKICDQHIRDDDNSYRELEFDRKWNIGIGIWIILSGCSFMLVFKLDIYRELLVYRCIYIYSKKMQCYTRYSDRWRFSKMTVHDGVSQSCNLLTTFWPPSVLCVLVYMKEQSSFQVFAEGMAGNPSNFYTNGGGVTMMQGYLLYKS